MSASPTPAPNANPEMELVLSSRRAAESAICIAMITSLLPGMEVNYIDPVLEEIPPNDAE